MKNAIGKILLWTALAAALGTTSAPQAAESPNVHAQSRQMPPELIKKTQEESLKAIKRGEQLWLDRNLGSNGLNCNVCHPDAAATHPETYPKFKQQLGRVVTVQEFINWCIYVALRGQRQEVGGEVLTALEAYQAYKNRGNVLEIGFPGP